jgi:hypothetical protein
MLSAAIVAAGSAFIPAEQPPGDIYVKVGSTFMLKSSQQGSCQFLNPSVCEYILRADASLPYTEEDFDFNPNEQKVWRPANR